MIDHSPKSIFEGGKNVGTLAINTVLIDANLHLSNGLDLDIWRPVSQPNKDSSNFQINDIYFFSSILRAHRD